jgi:predicted nucleotidyltransferase
VRAPRFTLHAAEFFTVAASRLSLADIEAELSRLLGGRKIDVRTPMDLSRHFREQVIRDALVLYAEP